jgi:hypothetical protein
MSQPRWFFPLCKKSAPAPRAAAVAADFDWDAGRECRPDQMGHEYEVDIHFDEEELDTIAAARCWIDYARCDCWAPLLLCSPKRCMVTQDERPSNKGADRLRHWWEENHENEFPTVYARPHPPDALFDLCVKREPLDDYIVQHSAVIESVQDFYGLDCDFPDDADGTYSPSISILQPQERRHFSPDSSTQAPVAEVIEPPAAFLASPAKAPKRKRASAAPSKPSVPRSSLLDRFMGLDPKLNYRTRILVMHWSALQMTRRDGHASWKLSGFIPFDPQIVLQPLGIDRNIKQSGVKQSLRLQEGRYLQDIQDAISNCQLSADVKLLQIHDILMRALNADVWQRRSIFADKAKQQEIESESSLDSDSGSSCSDSSVLTIPAYGAVGADIARRMEKKMIRDEEDLVKSKPFPCLLCPTMRYKTPRGLTNHIQAKHPRYPANGANDNAIVLQQPNIQRNPSAHVAPAPMAALTVAPAAAAAQRKCAICHQPGHRADNRKFHPNLPSA